MSKTKTKEVQVDNTWEIKDRNYFLLGDKSPITYTLNQDIQRNILYYGLMKKKKNKEH